MIGRAIGNMIFKKIIPSERHRYGLIQSDRQERRDEKGPKHKDTCCCIDGRDDDPQ